MLNFIFCDDLKKLVEPDATIFCHMSLPSESELYYISYLLHSTSYTNAGVACLIKML